MLIGLNDTADMIKSGKILHISADEKLLEKLPKGNWIGGTIPYFMAEDGGILTKEKLFVTEITCSTALNTKLYGANEIGSLANDAYENGFSLIIIPFGSEAHTFYSSYAPSIENIFLKNIVGWIAGADLSDTSAIPKVFDGVTGNSSADKAVVLHAELPEDKTANIGIINIFSVDGESPEIEFPDTSFEVDKCLIDGKEYLLSKYLEENNVDTKLPIVADYSGNIINISIKEIRENSVSFYAPVFKGIKYHFSSPVSEYSKEFNGKLSSFNEDNIVFSCNCILNYLYGELEGKKTAPFTGPVTFGEIAYQLVNQTLVYLSLI